MLKEEFQYLLRLLANCRDKLRRWIDSGEPSIIPGVPVYDAFEELANVIGTGTLEIDPESHGANEFRLGWEQFKRRLLATQDPTELPGVPFWDVWFVLENRLGQSEKKVVPVLEKIGTLVKDGVKPFQIARIYGWYRDNGAEDIAKVQEEIDDPGKHTANYIEPNAKRIHLMNQRIDEEASFWRARLEKKVNMATTATAPESLETLIRGRVSMRQIVSMKRVTREEIRAEADRLGIPHPPETYDLGGALFEEKMDGAKERLRDIQLSSPGKGGSSNRNHPALSTVTLGETSTGVGSPDAIADEVVGADEEDEEPVSDGTVVGDNAVEQVLGYASAGMSKADIARHSGLSRQKIDRILKKHQAQVPGE